MQGKMQKTSHGGALLPNQLTMTMTGMRVRKSVAAGYKISKPAAAIVGVEVGSEANRLKRSATIESIEDYI